MARGYPDFFGQSVFLQYGPAKLALADTVAIANDSKTVLTVTGKGVMYLGFLDVEGLGLVNDDLLQFYFDGNLFVNNTLANFADQWWRGEAPANVRCEVARPLSFYYALKLCGPLTYGTSIQIRYIETSGRTPDLFGRFWYADLV